MGEKGGEEKGREGRKGARRILLQGQEIDATVQHHLSALKPFNAHCCHMGTALKYPVQDRFKQSFVIFDIRVL